MFKWIIGSAASLCLIITMLLTSAEISVFLNSDSYYRKEYKKHNVYTTVNITEADLMSVTECFLDYLSGKRDNLNIETVIRGQTREFFNNREKQHMADVKILFEKAYNIRIALIIFLIISAIYFVKTKNLYSAAKSYVTTSSACCLVAVLLSIIISTDFNKYFTIFHKIFFDNDLWILNPRTDLLVNIVPEGFFIDMSIKIAVIFLIGVLTVFALSIFIILKRNKTT